MNSNNNPYGVEPVLTDANQIEFSPVKNNTLAITTLILGLLSPFLSILTALPGVITGHMALSKIKKNCTEYDGRGLAITGIILSYLFLILALVFIFAITYMSYEIPDFKNALTEGFNEGLQQGMQRNIPN